MIKFWKKRKIISASEDWLGHVVMYLEEFNGYDSAQEEVDKGIDYLNKLYTKNYDPFNASQLFWLKKIC